MPKEKCTLNVPWIGILLHGDRHIMKHFSLICSVSSRSILGLLPREPYSSCFSEYYPSAASLEMST